MAPQDARFARLKTDPRFRRPKQKHLKAEIDERFKDALSEDFGSISTKGEYLPLCSSSLHLLPP